MRSFESRPVSRVRAGIATALVLCVTLGGFPVSAAAPPETAKEAPPSVVTSGGDPEGDILLNVGAIMTGTPEAQGLRGAVASFEGRRLHLIQFARSIQPEWYASLQATGVDVIQYIPADSYLVYGDAAALASLQSMARNSAVVRWDGPYLDQHKIQPAADVKVRAKLGLGGDLDLFAIQLVADPAVNAETRKLVESLSAQGLKQRWEILRYSNLVAELPVGAVAQIAARPDVVSIDRHVRPRLFDERQDRIITGQLTGSLPTAGDHLTYLAGKGFTQAQFTASGFVVDVTDSGIDNATTTPNHFGLRLMGDLASAGRVQYSRLEGTPSSGSALQGCDGHGNLNAHIVAGYVGDAASLPSPGTHADASGFRYGLGVCPFVKVGSSVIFDPNYTDPSYPDLQARAYADNARISTNSWGADTAGAYTVEAQTYDALVRDAQPASSAVPTAGNQEMVIVFSAGNDGSSANTIGTPGVAKNVIAVGASEGVQALGGADNCATTDAEADSANDMAVFSSRGPADDGRFKPDLVAPGTHISGGVFQASASNTGSGTAAACFDGTGVCGGPSGSNFFPTTQQFYSASSGTSHSAPAVAGGAALVRQHFINNSLTPPSPAMTKAVLMNSAGYMNGSGANDTLPSNNQGMGLLNLDTSFSQLAGSRVVRDQRPVDTFTASGQESTITGNVADSGQPFRVTLAWTDAPGPTVGNAYVNNLDLEVTVGGNTYRGNAFTGGSSITGGSADPRNNTESVFLPAGLVGAYSVKVIATNIAGDGVPNSGGALDQDFALIIANATEVPQAVLRAGSGTVVADSCGGNGALDPGEDATVRLCLQNAGSLDTTDAVATLQATGGVTNPSVAQSYGALVAGAAAVCRDFTLTVGSLSCGEDLTATLQIEDGATDLGSQSWVFVTGTPLAIAAEAFDTVITPALPAGWTTTSESGGDAWTTVSTTPDTAPNAAFINNPATVSLTSLVSPSIAVPAGPAAVLTFRHSYDLEMLTTIAYDGGVLEIKIGAGAFQDIVTAGGAFTANGYNRTLSTGFGNPLGGRAAWSGNSGGYVTTTVALPTAASGHSVQLRWRRGSDSLYSRTGWRVDSISIQGGRECCIPPTDLSITKTDGQTSYVPGAALSYAIQVANAGPAAVTGATVTDTLPADLTSATWTCAASAGSSCGAASGSGDIAATVNLLVGGTATFTLDATASLAASGPISNTASVSPPSGGGDPNPANNSATDTDSRTPALDLSITKSNAVSGYVPGQAIVYTIGVSNAGPDAAVGATVADTLPADLTNATWTCTASAGSSCGAGSGNGDIATTVDLLAEGVVTFTVSATVSASAVDAIVNVASVTPPAGIVDLDLSNNSASDTDAFARGAFFSVAPCRVVDTRNAVGPYGGPALQGGASRTFLIAGQCGIPATATAVFMNVTVTQPGAAGHLSLYATGNPVPPTSAVNYSASQTRANNGVYPLSATGEIDLRCQQASGTAHAIVDVAGYFIE